MKAIRSLEMAGQIREHERLENQIAYHNGDQGTFTATPLAIILSDEIDIFEINNRLMRSNTGTYPSNI